MTHRARAAALIFPIALAACSKRTAAPAQRGPFLSISSTDVAPPARSIVTPAAVSLALGGLPPEELPRLRKRMAESTDGALRRAAPGLFDLDAPPDAGAVDDPLRRAVPDLRALTAAANMSASRWDAPWISVHLGPACETAAARCVPLFGTTSSSDDSLLRRGRTLAWALADAALLRVAAPARAGVLASLRDAQLRPGGTVAMVFAAARGTLDANELELLRHEARRSLDPLRPDAPQRPWLEALAAAQPTWELPVALEGDELLVVPRLSALARLPDFVSEIEAAGSFEWAARPGSLPTGRP